jgi:ribosomal protein S21
MADLKRKPGESFEAFLRKFKKALKNSKRLETARGKKHLEDKSNRNKQKKQALSGLKIRAEKEYLRKIGKLPENTR